jgi:3-oxoadipate enol-lactonase
MTLSRREALSLLGAGALGLACRGRQPLEYPYGAGMSTVAVGDIQLAYGMEGEGEPVLLLHGQGAHGRDWSLQTAALSKRYRVVYFDQRGHGGSSVTKRPYTMELLAKDAAGLCRALSLGPCHVVGHSLGGMVALQLALDFPALVRSLTVVNSTPVGYGSWLKGRLLRLFIRARGMPRFARVNTKLHLPEPDQEALRQRLVETMGSNSPDGYIANQDAVDHFDVSARLGEIACPVLVIHSAQDPIPLEEKELIVAKVKQGRLLTIEDSRHLVLWDQPERLNAALLEFLAGQATPPASASARG